MGAVCFKGRVHSETEPPPIAVIGSWNGGEGKVLLLVDGDNWPTLFKRLPFELPLNVAAAVFLRRDALPALDQWGVASAALREEGRLGVFSAMHHKDSADAVMIVRATELSSLLPRAAVVLVSKDAVFLQCQVELQRKGRAVYLIRSQSYEQLGMLLGGLCGTQLSCNEDTQKRAARSSARTRKRREGAPNLVQRSKANGTYKTVLCNKFDTPAGCPHGKRCIYAHGEDELRCRPSATPAATGSPPDEAAPPSGGSPSAEPGAGSDGDSGGTDGYVTPGEEADGVKVDE